MKNANIFPNMEWEVWYQDTFDRECPPKVDVRGRGLVQGLMELWARYLFETVTATGFQGFSRFWLHASSPAEYVSLQGCKKNSEEWEGSLKLRKWVFGEKQTTQKGYVNAGDKKLLQKVASLHVQLLSNEKHASEHILRLAAQLSRKEFEQRAI